MDDCPLVQVNRIAIANLEELLIQQYNKDFAEQHYENKEMSMEDKQFMSIFSKSAVLQDGHYYPKLPFREPDVSIPNDKHIALQKAQQLQKRLKETKHSWMNTRHSCMMLLKKDIQRLYPWTNWSQKVAKCGIYHIVGSTTQVKRISVKDMLLFVKDS